MQEDADLREQVEELIEKENLEAVLLACNETWPSGNYSEDILYELQTTNLMTGCTQDSECGLQEYCDTVSGIEGICVAGGACTYITTSTESDAQCPGTDMHCVCNQE
jgi:hypothetical protein